MNHLEKVKAVIEYVETSLTQKLDLDEIADAVHYSKYHLHRMFTQTVGLTIHEYAKRRQLTESAKLLIFSDKPILDIALLSGYESQQAFTAIFKAMYKQSPNQFKVNEVFYPLQLKYEFEGRFSMIDMSSHELLPHIRFATEDETPCWMELTRMVIDGFPYLDENEHIQVVRKCMEQKQALILKDDQLAVGIMLFSYETGNIDFLGVHPLYRKKGVAKAFLDKLMRELLPGKEIISTTTYREGDKADTGHREALTQLGFAEAELLIEFGYPTQKFILPKEEIHSDG